MKKLISLLLAVLMLATAGVQALAEEPEMVDYEEIGIAIPWVDEITALKGYYEEAPYGLISNDPAIALMMVYYVGATMEELMELDDDAVVEPLVPVIIMVTDGTKEDILNILEEETAENLRTIGSGEGYTGYYYLDGNVSNDLDPEFAEDYAAFLEKLPAALEKAKVHAPADPMVELVKEKITFTAKDADGKEYTSEELFKDCKVTMVNCWGTWCPHCVNEMPELAEINTRLQEKGCQVIGIEFESDYDEETLSEGKELMAEAGTNYISVLYNDDMTFMDQVQAYPITFFVDKDGNQLTVPVEGAQVDIYESLVDELLSSME